MGEMNKSEKIKWYVSFYFWYIFFMLKKSRTLLHLILLREYLYFKIFVDNVKNLFR
jgi:hypothetical protein